MITYILCVPSDLANVYKIDLKNTQTQNNNCNPQKVAPCGQIHSTQ